MRRGLSNDCEAEIANHCVEQRRDKGGDQLFMPDDDDQNLTSTAYNNYDKYHLHILVGNTFPMGCLLITTRGAIHSGHREKVRAGSEAANPVPHIHA